MPSASATGAPSSALGTQSPCSAMAALLTNPAARGVHEASRGPPSSVRLLQRGPSRLTPMSHPRSRTSSTQVRSGSRSHTMWRVASQGRVPVGHVLRESRCSASEQTQSGAEVASTLAKARTAHGVKSVV